MINRQLMGGFVLLVVALGAYRLLWRSPQQSATQFSATQPAEPLPTATEISPNAAGASDAEIFRMREAVYGAETAQRFAVTDQHPSQWQERIAAYRTQRQEILNTADMSNADKEAQIHQLRTQHFDALEQQRIPVIDSMMDQQSP